MLPLGISRDHPIPTPSAYDPELDGWIRAAKSNSSSTGIPVSPTSRPQPIKVGNSIFSRK